MQQGAIGIVVLALVLLAVGWMISSDLLGFLFMICLLTGIGLFVYDFATHRHRPATHTDRP